MLEINPVRIDQVTPPDVEVYQLDPGNWWHRCLMWVGRVKPTFNPQATLETFTVSQRQSLLEGLREATINFMIDTTQLSSKDYVILIGQKEFHELTGMSAHASWDLSFSGVVGNFLPKYQGFELHICRHISGFGIVPKKVVQNG